MNPIASILVGMAIQNEIRRIGGLLAALLFGLAPVAKAAHTQVQLILAADTARPGDTVLAGVRLRMDPQWHTYWRNSGDAGLPTTIQWTLPAGVTAGPIRWPVPEKVPENGLTTYIYRNEVVLLVPLTLAPNAKAGPMDLKAKVGWLECDTSCIPGSDTVQATLNIGAESKAGPDSALLDLWSKKLPAAKPDLAARAWWEKSATGDTRPLLIEWTAAGSAKDADFYPYDSDKFDVQPKTEPVYADAGKIRLRKTIQNLEVKTPWPTTISGLLVQASGNERVAYEVALPIKSSATAEAAVPERAATPIAPPPLAVASPHSLWLMLGYAFLGGLVLNVMPCVLPVIALKILGFVKEGREQPGEVRRLGLVYTAGVLTSFLALAALVIGVKLAGHRAGWGMQFGNPQFIVVMTVLVTLVALNLFGVFEVNLGGGIMGAAGQLSARNGTAGAFFNGVLATVLATPCTAPFLGIALGFAFAQSFAIIVAVFLTVGLGLAAPYVILSWNPAWLAFLPKPGAWMEKFKIAMGFPMLATALWLFDLTTVHYGRRILWLGIFLVLVALAAWVYGEFVQRGRTRRGLALAVTVLLLAGGYGYAIESELRWRSPIADSTAASPRTTEPGEVDWQPWSLEAVAAGQAGNRPVLVDFTADWCQICLINKKTSLEAKSVVKKLKEIDAVTLAGDYTKLPESITAELNHFGRAGVPLVLVYPAKPGAAPLVLPDGYLTPGIVLAALEKAAVQTTPPVSTANR